VQPITTKLQAYNYPEIKSP